MSEYNPLRSLTRLRKEMQSKIAESGELVIPGSTVDQPLISVQRKADVVCVLLKTLTEGGPIPDDLKGLRTSMAIRAHTRPDGGVYCGAYELQGQPESVVLVYGDPTLTDAQAERCASLERPALARRHSDWKLGPFAASPPDSNTLS